MLKLKKHFLIIDNNMNITKHAIFISPSLNGTYRLGIIGLYVSIKSPLTKYEILLKTNSDGNGDPRSQSKQTIKLEIQFDFINHIKDCYLDFKL